jgi:hypothetical protein
MQGRSVNLRVLFNSAVLLLSAVIAHTIACGTFIPALPFAIGSLIIVGSVTALSIAELRGPALALVVILVQSATHFLLGSGRMSMPAPICGGTSKQFFIPMGPMMTPSSMLSVHIAAGLFSYVFIRKSEKFWNFAGYCLIALFKPQASFGVTSELALFEQSKLQLTVLVTRLQSFLTEAVSRLAAPPLSLQFA